MKKMIALLLAAMMVLSMAACASKTADSDLAYIQDKGTLVIGITDFEPMDYKDADGSWIGFDADMAKAFAESLGVTAEFVEHRLGQQDPGARQQDHRLRLERHDPDRRGHEHYGMLQRLLQQRAGRHRPG